MPVLKLKTIVVAGAAAATMAIGIMPANAAGTWTVTAGNAPVGTTVPISGATTGPSPQIHFTDVTTGTALSCTSGTAKGSTKTGSGLPGAGIGKITGTTTGWVGCTGPLGIALTPHGHGIWLINGTNYNATTGTTNGTITNANATVTGTGCSFTVKGSVPISYKNSTGVLSVKSTVANLTVSAVSGCFGAVNDGDKANFKANYLLKANRASYNPIHITKP